MAGLYLHIPFCKQACHYCDFHFSTDQRYRLELCQAMATELALQKEYLRGVELQSIYLGGGTPSLLSANELNILFSAIHHHFSVSSSAEITLEANPDDLTPEKIQDYASIGINRLSIGIQSFNDTLLTFLNRAHDGHSAVKCLRDVGASSIQNYSLDLIFGIPGLSEEKWKETLEQALSFKPPHISSYALTIEEKTVFGHWQKKGRLKTEEEEAARHFEILMDMLEAAGYEHYEISNFCRP
ncbi:MAG: radical SAM family heme chaperone HemW, partial [Cyclobacteriaceae bacterium]|nr:radical SAM family heme chaperone HemW [Cyclobacteriaceae bacterium]